MPPPKSPPPVSLGQLSREQALREAPWVAAFLNVTEAWVREAARAGTLPCMRLGDELRFHPDAIKAWARGKTSHATTPEAADGPEFLTVDEAAALLRLNRNTLYEAVRAGQVPGVLRVGRLLRLRRADLKRGALTGLAADDLLASSGQGGSSLKEKK